MPMRALLSFFLALHLFTSTLPTLAQQSPGFQSLRLPAAHRQQALEVLLWYPAQAGGQAVSVAENRLFYGSAARQNAPLAAGRYPLVLVSHGMGGHAAGLGWIASQLAQGGFIVAAVNHPGSTAGDLNAAAAVQVWQRPADLSAVLTALLADPAWQPHIQPERVGVLGFSLGGYTALALAGARVNLRDYARYCDQPVPPGTVVAECPGFARGGVDLRMLDATRFGQDHHDARIRAVVAVDPGLAQAFEADSLRRIQVPIHIINLGRPGQIPLAVAAAPLAATIPTAHYASVPDATHFSFLGVCKPGGAALLARDGDDPVCDDGGGRSRNGIHQELVEKVRTGLNSLLK
jgi:predicted dienelactone hydrolase